MRIRPGLHVVVDKDFHVREVEIDDDGVTVIRDELKATPGQQVPAITAASRLTSEHRARGRHCALVMDGPAFFETLRALEQIKSGEAPAGPPPGVGAPKADVRDWVKEHTIPKPKDAG